MNQELQEKLKAEFPFAFQTNPEIGVPDGWYEIIRTLAMHLEAKRNRLTESVQWAEESFAKDSGKYYTTERIADLKAELEEEIQKNPHILQLKVKFGNATFYTNTGSHGRDRFMAGVTSALESIADRTCGNCSKIQPPDGITKMRENHCKYCVDSLKEEA